MSGICFFLYSGLLQEISYIMSSWTFNDYLTADGTNKFHEWLNSRDVSVGAKAKINARIVSLRGFTVFPEQYFSAYKGWDDLYELRIVFAGVQYRPFGCYGPGRWAFTLLVGGIEKGKVPKSILEVANERRKIVLAHPSRVCLHDYS
jgi:hypothetical protein